MSEEEKQAMKELKRYGNMTSYYKEREYTDIQIAKYINIVLNLIEKRQKDYISKDKIKAKIEVLKNKLDKNYNNDEDFIEWNNLINQIDLLQELLEGE